MATSKKTTVKPAEEKAVEEKKEETKKAKASEKAVRMLSTQCGSYGVLDKWQCYTLDAALADALVSGGVAEEIPF